MSEVPVPPPPPPPPVEPAKAQFDFGKPFTYVFEDPRWVNKILLGGLFYLAGFLLIGWFFVLGYMAKVSRNVIAGVTHPLPEWENVGELFAEGARLIGVFLVYIVPFTLIALAIVIPTGILGAVFEDNEGVQAVSGMMMGCMICLLFPLSLAVFLFLPASLLFAAAEESFSAAFAFGRIWNFIKANVGNYLLAVVVYLIARTLAGFGVMLLCIGVIFTGFWSMLISTNAFSQVYRLAHKKP